MCGRFVSSSPPDEIARYFDVEETSEKLLDPSYNVAPTNDVYVVYESAGVRRLETMRWGLIPFWADDAKIGNRMINARAETLAEKNAYRRPYRKNRCVIPADGFYEWKKVPGQKRKQPFFVRRTDDDPFAFAGLWETWRPHKNNDDEVHSCTIITGDPNEKMIEIHDRMPVVLPPNTWTTWLDEDNQDTSTLGKFLVPAPAKLFSFYPVSTDVNNPRNAGVQLSQPCDEAEDSPMEEGKLL